MRFDEEKTNNFEKESPLHTFKDLNITPEKALPFDICDPIFLSTGLHFIWQKEQPCIRSEQRHLREAEKMVNKSLSNFLI